MDSPQINKSWNKYETALLIDTYEKVSKGVVGRTDAVSQLSKRLRDGMTAMGVSISDTFRNENGISMQMSTIKNLLTDIDSTFGNPSHVLLICVIYILTIGSLLIRYLAQQAECSLLAILNLQYKIRLHTMLIATSL